MMNEFENQGFVRRNAIPLVILLAMIVFGLLLYKGVGTSLNTEIDGMVTITGNFSCLPLLPANPADSFMALPEDCELGVRSRDGLYYALDINRIQDANTDLKAEDTIAVTGTINPNQDITSSYWAKYDIAGIIQVNTLLRTR